MAKIKNMGTATMRFGEGLIATGSAGTDTYSLVVSGSTKNIDNLIVDGRIGIGTDNPAYKLEVGGSISVGESVVHRNDEHTKMEFHDTGDRIQFYAGSEILLGIQKNANSGNPPHQVTVNNTNKNCDFVVKSNDVSTSPIIHTIADGAKVGIRTDSPDHELHVNGTIKMNTMVVNVRDVGTSSSIQDSDYCVRCIQTGAIQLTLPTKTNNAGKVLVIKDALGNASSHNITIVGHGTGASQDKIDGPTGSTSYAINTNHSAVTLICDGINGWMIVAKA